MMTKLSTALLLATSLVACARNQDGDNLDNAESALDSQESVEAEGNVMMSALEDADMQLLAPTADQVAARIAANITARNTPTGCATATASGANVTVTYDNCSGPRGLLHVTGQLDLAVAVSLSGIVSVHGSATDLEVNRAVLDIDADATYTRSGTSHSVSVTTHGSGIGPRGNSIEHQGDYAITVDTATQCRSIAGQWSTEFTGPNATARRSNDVDVERCAGGCPSGTVVHTFLGGNSVTITFDGTATASWAGSGGRSGSIQLLCQP